MPGEAIVRLAAKVRVKAHLAKRGKKVVPVIAYERTNPFAGWTTEFDEGDFGQSYMKLRDERGVWAGEIGWRDTMRDEIGIDVTSIYVPKERRGKGVAVEMARRLSEHTGLPLVHGSFSTPEGAEFGVFMAAAYPLWNKLWLNASPELGVQLWKPSMGISPEASTFDPVDWELRARLPAAIARGLANAKKVRGN